MATTKETTLILRARDEASRTLGQVSNNLVAFRRVVGEVAAAVATYAALREVVEFLKESAKAAAESEVAQARLSTALEREGKSYQDVAPELDAHFQRIQRNTKFEDETASEVLTQLISITHDYDGSLKLLEPTLDLMAGRHMEAAAASKAVAGALNGNVAALGKAGVALDDHEKKVLADGTATQKLDIITNALTKTWGGTAAAEGKTFSGQLTIIRNLFGEVQEKVGDTLIKSGSFRKLLDELADALVRVAKFVEENKDVLIEWADLGATAAAVALAFLGKTVIAVAVGISDLSERYHRAQALVAVASAGIVDALTAVVEAASKIPGVGQSFVGVVEAMRASSAELRKEAREYAEAALADNQRTEATVELYEKARKALDNLVKAVERAKGARVELPKPKVGAEGDEGAAAGKGLFTELSERSQRELKVLKDELASQLRTLITSEELLPAVETLSRLPAALREVVVSRIQEGELAGPLIEQASEAAKVLAQFPEMARDEIVAKIAGGSPIAPLVEQIKADLEQLPPLVGKSAAETVDAAEQLKEGLAQIDDPEAAEAALKALYALGDALAVVRDETLPLSERFKALKESEDLATQAHLAWTDVLRDGGEETAAAVEELEKLDEALRKIGGSWEGIADATKGTSDPLEFTLALFQKIREAKEQGIPVDDDLIEKLQEMSAAAAEQYRAVTLLELAYDTFQSAILGVGAAFGRAAAAGVSAAGLVKAALLRAIATYLQGLAKEQAIEAAAAAASYRYDQAVLHAAAAALAAAGASYVSGLASKAESGKAAKGGIVAGTEVGDKQPFLLEAGEPVLTRPAGSLIFGGRAALIDPESFLNIVSTALEEARSVADAMPSPQPVTVDVELAGARTSATEVFESLSTAVEEAGEPGAGGRVQPAGSAPAAAIVRAIEATASTLESISEAITTLERTSELTEISRTETHVTLATTPARAGESGTTAPAPVEASTSRSSTNVREVQKRIESEERSETERTTLEVASALLERVDRESSERIERALQAAVSTSTTNAVAEASSALRESTSVFSSAETSETTTSASRSLVTASEALREASTEVLRDRDTHVSELASSIAKTTDAVHASYDLVERSVSSVEEAVRTFRDSWRSVASSRESETLLLEAAPGGAPGAPPTAEAQAEAIASSVLEAADAVHESRTAIERSLEVLRSSEALSVATSAVESALEISREASSLLGAPATPSGRESGQQTLTPLTPPSLEAIAESIAEASSSVLAELPTVLEQAISLVVPRTEGEPARGAAPAGSEAAELAPTPRASLEASVELVIQVLLKATAETERTTSSLARSAERFSTATTSLLAAASVETTTSSLAETRETTRDALRESLSSSVGSVRTLSERTQPERTADIARSIEVLSSTSTASLESLQQISERQASLAHSFSVDVAEKIVQAIESVTLETRTVEVREAVRESLALATSTFAEALRSERAEALEVRSTEETTTTADRTETRESETTTAIVERALESFESSVTTTTSAITSASSSFSEAVVVMSREVTVLSDTMRDLISSIEDVTRFAAFVPGSGPYPIAHNPPPHFHPYPGYNPPAHEQPNPANPNDRTAGATAPAGSLTYAVQAAAEAVANAVSVTLPTLERPEQITAAVQFGSPEHIPGYLSRERELFSFASRRESGAQLAEVVRDAIRESIHESVREGIREQTSALSVTISRSSREVSPAGPQAVVNAEFHGATRTQAEDLLSDINELVRNRGFELTSSGLTETSPDKRR